MIKIFIDQGHNPGLINAGANANGINEADLTYQVGMYLYALLLGDPRFEVRVSRMYRDSVLGYDQRSSLQNRVNQANEWQADFFISIHGNANENVNVNGCEAYVYQKNNQAYFMSEVILGFISDLVGIRNNGIYINPSLFVLRRTIMPALLLELGYLSNINDARLLKQYEFEFAYSIYLGILSYHEFQ